MRKPSVLQKKIYITKIVGHKTSKSVRISYFNDPQLSENNVVNQVLRKNNQFPIEITVGKSRSTVFDSMHFFCRMLKFAAISIVNRKNCTPNF